MSVTREQVKQKLEELYAGQDLAKIGQKTLRKSLTEALGQDPGKELCTQVAVEMIREKHSFFDSPPHLFFFFFARFFVVLPFTAPHRRSCWRRRGGRGGGGQRRGSRGGGRGAKGKGHQEAQQVHQGELLRHQEEKEEGSQHAQEGPIELHDFSGRKQSETRKKETKDMAAELLFSIQRSVSRLPIRRSK